MLKHEQIHAAAITSEYMKNMLDAKYCMYVKPKGKNRDWKREIKKRFKKLKEMS